jgi:hypothetical protein
LSAEENQIQMRISPRRAAVVSISDRDWTAPNHDWLEQQGDNALLKTCQRLQRRLCAQKDIAHAKTDFARTNSRVVFSFIFKFQEVDSSVQSAASFRTVAFFNGEPAINARFGQSLLFLIEIR